MTDAELVALKLFPRNVTARADHAVRGNPVTTRPESGVENSFPGLEFDVRNLDKAFFPGLIFEFHSSDAVPLREVRRSTLLEGADLAAGIYLLALRGQFPVRGAAPRGTRTETVVFSRLTDLDAWRVIRDLEPGPLAILLGDEVGRASFRRLDPEEFLERVFAGGASDARIPISEDGALYALFAERTRFVDRAGVLDEALEPGDLTRSLCSPWQHDFADCGCFYWASNKPDLVTSDPDRAAVLNFQRRDRSRDAEVTEADWLNGWDRRENILTHREMIERWGALPFVFEGLETDRFPIRTPVTHRPPLDRATITGRLRALARVEHALAVEYLYAYYSMGQPPRPTATDTQGRRLFTAADEILRVAVDEMRHLRWVNEILASMGEPLELGRAAVIGEDWDGDGRALLHTFELKPLTPDRLNWFIQVERPSADFDPEGDEDTIDGMYTRLLVSLEASDEFTSDEKQRYAQLLKVVIDEGMEHVRRFERAREALDGIPAERWVTVTSGPTDEAPSTPLGILQDAADKSYEVLLKALEFVFTVDDGQQGELLEAARRAMYNMDDAARLLARHEVGMRFRLPPQPAGAAAGFAAGPPSPDALVRGIAAPGLAAAGALAATGESELVGLAGRMEARIGEMVRAFEAALAGR
jgi:hypothetical protein